MSSEIGRAKGHHHYTTVSVSSAGVELVIWRDEGNGFGDSFSPDVARGLTALLVGAIDLFEKRFNARQESEENRVLQAMDRAGMDAGIYRKFIVERVDGSSGSGRKHEHCEYFVLDWAHDPFAPAAARAYADACEAQYPALAADLRAKAEKAGL